MRYPLRLDPAIAAWKCLAEEWIQTRTNPKDKRKALHSFFADYIHRNHSDKNPTALLDAGVPVPLLISGFLDWIAERRGMKS